jgi:hypothetical protein
MLIDCFSKKFDFLLLVFTCIFLAAVVLLGEIGSPRITSA